MIKTSALDTINNAYQDGDANVNLKGSQLPADDWNMIQSELCNAAQAMGVPLDKGSHSQIKIAVVAVARDVYKQSVFSKSRTGMTVGETSVAVGIVLDIPGNTVVDLDAVFDIPGNYTSGEFVELVGTLSYGSESRFVYVTRALNVKGTQRHRSTLFFDIHDQKDSAATLTLYVRTTHSSVGGSVALNLTIGGYVENSR